MIGKKLRYLAAGLIIGSIFTFSLQSFADTSRIVPAIIGSLINFEVNDEEKDLTEEYEILTYRDRTYVPARLLAEELDIEVEWDEKTNTMSITSNIKEELEEEEETEEPKRDRDYKELPITKSDHNMNLSATLVIKDSGHYRVDFKLENRSNVPLQLLQKETIIEADGVEYSMKDTPFHRYDTRWYNDIREDEIRQGYITLPKMPDDIKELHLVVKVMENNGTGNTSELEFNIAL